jgi:hypothetical protein
MISTENTTDGTMQMTEQRAEKNPELIVFSRDEALVERLRPFAQGIPYLKWEVGNGPQVTAATELDALWATLMVGAELFGAVPPFPLHEARVHLTPAAQLKRGLPRYGVVGVPLLPEESQSPESNLRLVLSALLKAVNSFNTQTSDRINRVGILPDDLELKKLDPETAFRIIQEVYEQTA